MKFSTREDIAAPIDEVFEMLCDFDRFERAAMRRGAEIQRQDNLPEPGKGAEWDVRFRMRGKERQAKLNVVTFDRPEELVVALSSQGVVGEMSFELIALSLTKTRMIVALDLRPLTLPARLLLQSLKLTKTSLNSKYKARIAEYVAGLQEQINEKT